MGDGDVLDALPADVKDAAEMVGKAVYDAIELVEQLERRGMILGRGWDCRAEIVRLAKLELISRWKMARSCRGDLT